MENLWEKHYRTVARWNCDHGTLGASKGDNMVTANKQGIETAKNKQINIPSSRHHHKEDI